MPRKAILLYTTTVDAAKTVSEIEAVLVNHGAQAVLKEWDKDGQVCALSFRLDSPRGELSVRIPIKIAIIQDMLWKKYCAGKLTKKYSDRSQAVRIAWRIAKSWIEVQCAMMELEQAEASEIFLPYLQTPGGQTFFEVITKQNLLPAGKKEA